MSFVSDLRSKILASVPGALVTWKYRGQNTALPAIVLHMVAGETAQTFAGPIGTQRYRIQADCLASSKLEVEALRSSVVATLIAQETVGATDFQGGFINLFRDMTDDAPDGVTHTEQIDATIWFN